MSTPSSKKYAFETIQDPNVRYNFDLLSKQIDALQNSLQTVNFSETSKTADQTKSTSIFSSYTAIQPLNLNFTTSGNPVLVSLQPRTGDAQYQGNVVVSSTGISATTAYLRFYRDGNVIWETKFGYDDSAAASTRNSYHSPAQFWTIDKNPPAGKHVYEVRAAVALAGVTVFFNFVRLTALEIQGKSQLIG